VNPPGGAGTQTGKIWERTIVPSLEASYPGRYAKQVKVGKHLYGTAYKADFLVDGTIVLSAKWQQTGGTAEQKLLYDIACLIDIIRKGGGRYRKAYVVLGGKGFGEGARAFLLRQGHRDYLQDGQLVEVVSVDDFIGRVNRQAL
jgi:hypothetical protein